MAGVPLSIAPRAGSVPPDRRGAAFRYVADRIAGDPTVRAARILLSVAGGRPTDDDPATATRPRGWIDCAPEPEELHAYGHAARVYRSPVLVRIAVQLPDGRPGEELAALYEALASAAYQAAREPGASAAGVRWAEPGPGPSDVPAERILLGAVRLVCFLAR